MYYIIPHQLYDVKIFFKKNFVFGAKFIRKSAKSMQFCVLPLKHKLIIPLVAFFVNFFLKIFLGMEPYIFRVADFWYRHVGMYSSAFYLTPLVHKRLQKNL